MIRKPRYTITTQSGRSGFVDPLKSRTPLVPTKFWGDVFSFERAPNGGDRWPTCVSRADRYEKSTAKCNYCKIIMSSFWGFAVPILKKCAVDTEATRMNVPQPPPFTYPATWLYPHFYRPTNDNNQRLVIYAVRTRIEGRWQQGWNVVWSDESCPSRFRQRWNMNVVSRRCSENSMKHSETGTYTVDISHHATTNSQSVKPQTIVGPGQRSALWSSLEW